MHERNRSTGLGANDFSLRSGPGGLPWCGYLSARFSPVPMGIWSHSTSSQNRSIIRQSEDEPSLSGLPKIRIMKSNRRLWTNALPVLVILSRPQFLHYSSSPGGNKKRCHWGSLATPARTTWNVGERTTRAVGQQSVYGDNRAGSKSW